MLNEINSPEQLKKLNLKQLQELAAEIRKELVETVSENGGHLASNLGIVELTIALHYVFDCPEDKFIFDVGHQSYVHKLLTGRANRFHTLRKEGGVSGFPDPAESDCDCFVAGHASTAVSAALGMARTRDIMHADNNVIAIVGDGALTGGMCYEALNDAGQSETRMIVILNDNAMSISRNVGAMSRYLSSLRQSRSYRAFKRGIRRGLEKIPRVGNRMFRFIERIRDALKSFFIDGRFFEALGFNYIGPIDGHDLKHMIRIFKRARNDARPLLIHVVTQKGKGYQPAENRPDKFHGIAPFYIDSGKARSVSSEPGCGMIAAHILSELADNDIRLSVICAAMVHGTGMEEFEKAHPDRFFDVGIAEEHAVTMAAGMAASGMKPYVALYSTFLQRSYDQMLIDVCRPNLPVTFLIDHAGFVGADGRTHQGLFDLSFMRTMPNLVIAIPRDARELKRMVALSTNVSAPMAIRYPKDSLDLGAAMASQNDFGVGEWELISDGEDVMIYACGTMVQRAMQAAIELYSRRIRCGVVDARFLKPMDTKMLVETGKKVRMVVTLEENTTLGGLGDAVAHELAAHGIRRRILMLGAPDRFVPHAGAEVQRRNCGLAPEDICARVYHAFNAEEGEDA